MKYYLLILLNLFLVFNLKAEVVAPQTSQTCVACHGIKGLSSAPIWPNLAGQKAQYLEKQLLDFKNGKRTDPMMSPLAKTLSDEDIKQLAEYYSSL